MKCTVERGISQGRVLSRNKKVFSEKFDNTFWRNVCGKCEMSSEFLDNTGCNSNLMNLVNYSYYFVHVILVRTLLSN